MTTNEDQNLECPLCMEPLEMDDINFYPCTCGYQICRFCWHRIRTDENGLCPACRKQYPEDPADFKPLTPEEMQRIKNEKRQKDMQRKQKISENRKHLANVRVVQRNLVFVVGLPPRLADSEVLKKHDYFGKFGKIHKVVVNHSTSYAGSQGPSASAYVTYYKAEDALRAIQAVNNIHVDGRTLKASLGTTKYCSHFLKNQQCPKPDCMYLHELGDESASFTKEEMQQGKHQEYEKKLYEQMLTFNHINRKHSTSPTNQSQSSQKEGWPSLHIIKGEHRPNGLSKTIHHPQLGHKEQKSPNSIHSNKIRHPSDESDHRGITQDRSPDTISQMNVYSNISNSFSTREDGAKSQYEHHQSNENYSPSCQILDQSTDNLLPINSSSSNCCKMRTSASNSSVNLQGNFLENYSQEIPHLYRENEHHHQSQNLMPQVGSDFTARLPVCQSNSPVTVNGISNNISRTPSPLPIAPSSKSFCGWSGMTQHLENKPFPLSTANSLISSDSNRSVEYNDVKRPDYNSLFSSSRSFLLNERIPQPLSSNSKWLRHSALPPTSESCMQNKYSDWPTAFMSSSNLQKSQDDDLGFDPWDESSKGLADLLEKESVLRSESTQNRSSNVFGNSTSNLINPSSYHSQYLGFQSQLPQRRVVSPTPPPPPGFAPNQLNTYSNMTRTSFGAVSESLPSKMSVMNMPPCRPTMNGPMSYYQDHVMHSQMGVANHNKHIPVPGIRPKQDWQDGIRNLLPNMNVNFGPHGPHQTAPSLGGSVHKGPVWNSGPDTPWIVPETNSVSANSVMENQSDCSPHWLKSLQQLTVDDSSSNYSNYHLQYNTPFHYRDL